MWLPPGVILHSCVVSVALGEEVTNIVQGYEMLKYTSAHTRMRPTTESRIFHTLQCYGQGWLNAIAVRSVRSEKLALFQGLRQTYFISVLLHCSTCISGG
jgi:hypothetical protein